MPRDLVIVTLDSCRHDTLAEARTPNLDRLGEIERRWSYASWTAPSHYNLLMGLLPHESPKGVTAGGYWKLDIMRYAERLGIEHPNFAHLSTSTMLPAWLRSLGYRTHALVSMPILWPHGPLNFGFDTYRLMPEFNDFRAMLPRLEFRAPCPNTNSCRPSFYILNVGETHYPYCAAGSTEGRHWPRLSGVHGVFSRIEDVRVGPHEFDADAMAELRRRQVRMAEHCDGIIGDLYRVLPADTWLIVTADHGELFGEGGHFGHGPVQHEKVFEVPFVEGLVPEC